MEPTFEALIIFISLLWFRSNWSLCLSRSICIMLSFHVYYSVTPVTWWALWRQRPVSPGHTKQISQCLTCVIAENLVCNSEFQVWFSECPWRFFDDSSACRSHVTHSGLTGCHWALPPAAPALHRCSAVVPHRYHSPFGTCLPVTQRCQGCHLLTLPTQGGWILLSDLPLLCEHWCCPGWGPHVFESYVKQRHICNPIHLSSYG